MAKSKKVLLTREDNSAVAEILKSKGVGAIELPLVKINLQAEEDELRDVFAEMGRYDWLTFSSVNGVRGFFGELVEEIGIPAISEHLMNVIDKRLARGESDAIAQVLEEK